MVVKLRLLFLILILLNISTLTFSQENTVEILYINSYHNGYFWSDSVTEGIKNTIGKHSSYVLNVEYLDSKREPDYYKDTLCLNYFNHKYLHKNIKLIITSDNDALDFVLKHKDHPIFSNKIVVACGISNIEDYENIPNTYLVKEITTFEETIAIMAAFFPKTEELVFITDRLTSGQIYMKQVANILNKNYPGIKLRIIDCIDLKTISDTISKIKFPSVVFCSSVNSDCYNKAINDYDVAEIIAKNADVPLFSGYYCSIMEGYVGGSMTTGSQNGKIAANLAIDILEKKSTPVKKITIPEVINIFDYNQLTRFNIGREIIPNNSEILRRPESFWKKYRKIIVIGSLIILQLLIVIGLLFRSVTNQKKYEKKLIEAMEKAKESDRLKSIFLENVSHEMRTPLNSIVGFSDVLSEMLPSGTEKKYLKIISENALLLTHLINHVFDFSLLKSHKYELNIATFNLSALVNEICDSEELKKHFGNKPIILTRDFDPNFPYVSITTDKEKLHLVIRHILSNAYKFTNNGEITIKYRYSDNQSETFKPKEEFGELKYVNFQIEDTGIGISQKNLDCIFEPFRQVDETDIDANRGLGLGLSISKSIINILNGNIRVESVPGVGTSFYFTIPLHLKEQFRNTQS